MSETKKDLYDQAKSFYEDDLRLELEPEVLQQMLKEKSSENLKLQELLTSTKEQLADVKVRALNVHERNKMYEADPELAAEMARMEYHMNLANRFILSGAFKANNAEEAYVKIKAGEEMGMKPIESMQALYCTNGAVRFYGDKMLGRITKHGYKVDYLKETTKSVSVRIYHPSEDIDFDETEVVNDTDQILQKSTAAKFAKKNKMRFHGIRMIASFHLPHLFSSVEDEFTKEFREFEEGRKTNLLTGGQRSGKARDRILDQIQKAKDNLHLPTLLKVEGHKVEYDVIDEYDDALKTILSHNKSTENEQ